MGFALPPVVVVVFQALVERVGLGKAPSFSYFSLGFSKLRVVFLYFITHYL